MALQSILRATIAEAGKRTLKANKNLNSAPELIYIIAIFA